MKKIKVFTASLLALTVISDAQLWYNKGQLVHTDYGIQIRVEGSFENDSMAYSQHNGRIVIDSSFYNLHGSFQQGNGVYDLNGNWLNSAVFSGDTGFVHLQGADEFIEGDSVSRFYNLSTEGSGRKILKINTVVLNQLYLNSLEFATNQDTIFIENPDPAAIQVSIAFGDEGFVSTLDSGCLVRKTNASATYYFPFGSIVGTARFRPVNLVPDSSSVNSFALSFQNKNASLDGYLTSHMDSDVCKVNPFFYHSLNRLYGTSGVSITLGYLIGEDGIWTEIGNWKSSVLKWNNTDQGQKAVLNDYNAVLRKGWKNFSNKPYALENFEPLIDSVSGPALLCKSEGSVYSVYTPDRGPYVFSWTAEGAVFGGDSTGSNISFHYSTPGSKMISVILTDRSTGCVSVPFDKRLMVSPGPRAGFYLSFTDLFENAPVLLKDTSFGADSWRWTFGNGLGSTFENPITQYEAAGSYTIRQWVSDSAGCNDSAQYMLDIFCSLKVPNVFSPNGDGINDIFLIQGLCINDYTIEIIDRWGLTLFVGSATSGGWDGRTVAGEECPSGTYYYVLRLLMEGKEMVKKGFLTLLR